MLSESMWRALSKLLPLTLTLSPLREERNGERERGIDDAGIGEQDRAAVGEHGSLDSA
jgi:hypothetical protein